MNTRSFRIFQYLCFALLLLISFSCAARKPKTGAELGEPKSEMFVSTKELIDKAASEHAAELASDNYYKAVKYYSEAEEDFNKGKDTDKIQKHLNKAKDHAQKSLEFAQSVNSRFPNLIESRDKALAVKANEMNLKSYKEGDKYYRKTLSDLKDDDVSEARDNAEKAIKEFQTAELDAIQRNTVSNLDKELKEAEKEGAHTWAPETYKTAQKHRDAALQQLALDRYNQGAAQQEVEKGEYYVRKSMFLTDKIKESKQDRASWEKLFLAREKDLNRLAKPLDLEPDFEEGFEKPVSEIDQAIKELKQREQALYARLNQTEQTLARTQQEARQTQLQREREQAQLQREREREKVSKPITKPMEEQVRNIQGLFAPYEAKVTVDPANNILITMSGINFDFGKSSLKPENLPTLSKIQKVAQMMPDRTIKVIGHTDSVGDNEFNKRLSMERAKSVAFYLENQLGIQPGRIEAMGAGETLPIAPNTSPDGRRLNRRIEINFLAQ